MEWAHEVFTLTDNPDRVNLDRTYELLQATYWGVRRPQDVVKSMVEHSLPFVLLLDAEQVGFGRAVSDYTVFTWVADIVIDPAHRGKGLGKWMMSCIRQHPAIKHTQMVLQTRDAHALYEKYGFSRNMALMSTKVDGI